jgi:tRNA nucleotidyltransferase (CCA-adding enzyme)
MVDKIKSEVREVYYTIEKAGYEVFFVGGCVRNLLMDREVLDWDLTTNATPQDLQKLFPDSFYDNDFGTVGVPYTIQNEDSEKKQYCEVTTFRTENAYSNNRHPDSVSWGKSIEEDLSRRDFTMNAIALKLQTKNEKLEPILIDHYNGQEDIKAKKIRAVGIAEERFKEDALRVMRAIRFASQLDFQIEETTWNALVVDAPLIVNISYERIRDEFFKILASESPHKGITLLDESLILERILPELTNGKGISQVRPGRHHTTDVFTHNILSMKECPSNDPLVRFATLLHDIGKPYVAKDDEEGHVTFYNHEVIGARIAADICDRFRLSKKQKQKVVTLIRWHMFTIDEHITDSAVRRFIRRVGIENVSDMIDLRIGDRLGGGTQVAESWRLKKFKERLVEQLNPPFSINDLAIDGSDIMSELDLKPGPKIGEILKTLFEEVDEDLSKNNREYLLKKIHEVETVEANK